MAMEIVRRRTISMQVFATAMAALAFVLSVPAVRSLGLDSQSLGSVTATSGAQRERTQSEKIGKGLKIDLMFYHHDQSPYSTANLSLNDRVLIAIESSHERAEYFDAKILKKRRSSKAVYTSPVYSNQGSYLMEIQMGTPARTFVAIADTGSDLVWVQCAPCTNCFSQPDPYFNPSQSSTYSLGSCSSGLCLELPSYSCSGSLACNYKYAYGDQSTTQGVFSTDTITLASSSGGSQPFSNFGFGCGTQNRGTFSNADGLVGLGRGPVSLVNQLGSQFGSVFSYCLVSFYSSTSTTSPMVLGNSGGSLIYTPLVYNSINPSFYYVNLQGILVNGSPLSIPQGTFSLDSAGGGGTILDSGTTITQLQMAAYNPLLNTLEGLINYPRVDGSAIGLDLCYDFSTVSNPTVPVVTFQFQNVNVGLPGNNLFLQVNNQGVSCLAIQGSNFGFGIYGNIQQQNFNIQYDIGQGQVGFAATTC